MIGEVVRQNILRIATLEGSQNKLAKKCGITQSTMNGICTGRSDASLSTIERIAEHYSLLPWHFLVEQLDPKNPPIIQVITEKERALHAKFQELFSAIKESQ